MTIALHARLIEWTRRYLPLELAATGAALAGAWLAATFSSPAVVTAFAAAISENVGFYAVATVREWRRQQGADSADTNKPKRFLRTVTQVIREFGPAELVDSFVSRPACMYAATTLLDSLGAGVIVGKVAADIVFYGIVIIAHERRKLR